MLVDDLADALGKQPGLTAGELAQRVGAAPGKRHRAWREGDVRLALAGEPGRFCCDGAAPPRWWLAAPAGCPHLRPVPRVPPRPVPPAPAPLGLRLYSWQTDALEAWARRGHRGVVEAVTGTGKTVLGLAAVHDELGCGGQALVLVPTIELMQQWRREIQRVLGRRVRVGCLGGAERASFAVHDVVVSVVNSARAAQLRPIRRSALLVADECHRYASAVNRLALGEAFGRRLGLSATYARDDDAHLEWLEPYFGGTCFQMGHRRAAADGVIARFSLALVAVTLGEEERDRYDELSDEIGRYLARLVRRHGVATEPFGELLKALHALASGAIPSEAQQEARALLVLLAERRRLLADTPAKLDALSALARAIAAAGRTLVFTQSIAAAERATEALCAESLRAATLHSRLESRARRETLARFSAGSLQVIVAPRVLDEGIDVPEADLAVIVTASRSRRQMVQRMGRVLRRKPDGRRARIAVLYVAGTVEDPAAGAHEAFLSEVTEAAEEVRDFRHRDEWTAAAAFLELSWARQQASRAATGR